MADNAASSINFTDMIIGAVLSRDAGTPSAEVTVLAAITAGRPSKREMTAAAGCAPPSVRLNWLRRITPRMVGWRPRIYSMMEAMPGLTVANHFASAGRLPTRE